MLNASFDTCFHWSKFLELKESTMVYLLKARTVEAEKQPLIGNVRTHAAEERVTSRNNRRGVASGVLCGRAPPALLCNGAVNTMNQHATINEAVFSVGAAPRLYNEDLKQLELKCSRVSGASSWQNN
jgi:hypothetical protein